MAMTVPLELTARSELARPARVSWPVELNDEVAEAPKKAPLYAENSVVDAPPWNCWREVQVFGCPRSCALEVRHVPAIAKQPPFARLMPPVDVCVVVDVVKLATP